MAPETYKWKRTLKTTVVFPPSRDSNCIVHCKITFENGTKHEVYHHFTSACLNLEPSRLRSLREILMRSLVASTQIIAGFTVAVFVIKCFISTRKKERTFLDRKQFLAERNIREGPMFVSSSPATNADVRADSLFAGGYSALRLFSYTGRTFLFFRPPTWRCSRVSKVLTRTLGTRAKNCVCE